MTGASQQDEKAYTTKSKDVYSRNGWAIAIILTSTLFLLTFDFFKHNSLHIGISIEPVTRIKDADCRLTLGSWCSSWNDQKEIQWKAPQYRPLKNCLWNCNGVGVSM